MPVLKKLMQARVLLAAQPLKKSGENKFAGYKYFELADFLPQTMQLFYDLELASTVSFTPDTATLTITDCEDGSSMVITSPMAEANLKGAHPIQNLGAVQSYQRRYLWMAALELVEHDAIDASEPERPKEQTKPAAKPEIKPAPPKQIVGQGGQWQISLSVSPDSEGWLDVVGQACGTALDMTESVDDVMQIFKKNKQLFDAVKAHDPNYFKTLMAQFTDAKNRHSEKS